MIAGLASVAGLAALFVLYGLAQRGREHLSCLTCACRGGVCQRTGQPRRLEGVESNDVAS
jgi:hypothetical protein